MFSRISKRGKTEHTMNRPFETAYTNLYKAYRQFIYIIDSLSTI